MYVHLCVRHVPLSCYSNTPLRIARHMANFETATFLRSLFGLLTICDNLWPQETKTRVQHEHKRRQEAREHGKRRSRRQRSKTKLKTKWSSAQSRWKNRAGGGEAESKSRRERERERERGVAHSCTHYATNLFGLGLGQNLNISAPTTKTTSTDFSRFGLVLLDCFNKRTNGSSSIDRSIAAPIYDFACIFVACSVAASSSSSSAVASSQINKNVGWKLFSTWSWIVTPSPNLLLSLAHSWQTHSPFINFYCLIELTWVGLGFNEGSFFGLIESIEPGKNGNSYDRYERAPLPHCLTAWAPLPAAPFPFRALLTVRLVLDSISDLCQYLLALFTARAAFGICIEFVINLPDKQQAVWELWG